MSLSCVVKLVSAHCLLCALPSQKSCHLCCSSCIEVLLQVKQLAEEIIAHIRDVAGADALVSAFTAAKKAVSAVRNERKQRAAVQVSFIGTVLSVQHVYSFLLSERNLASCLRLTPLKFCQAQRWHCSSMFCYWLLACRYW